MWLQFSDTLPDWATGDLPITFFSSAALGRTISYSLTVPIPASWNCANDDLLHSVMLTGVTDEEDKSFE
jgi:hypothetical protein